MLLTKFLACVTILLDSKPTKNIQREWALESEMPISTSVPVSGRQAVSPVQVKPAIAGQLAHRGTNRVLGFKVTHSE